jgi:hypothetical protein
VSDETTGGFIICPHCLYEDTDMGDYPWNAFDNNPHVPVGTYCQSCGKDFMVSCERSYTFHASKEKDSK